VCLELIQIAQEVADRKIYPETAEDRFNEALKKAKLPVRVAKHLRESIRQFFHDLESGINASTLASNFRADLSDYFVQVEAKPQGGRLVKVGS
jgi:hypothetical protein